ncbi:hypothetical protein ABI59_17150 [Acidobacteria bacterium Mor1]|nr:hypothetical protein ABI59_17150 [Acidobacteria bacterium Mor1]
MSLLLYTTALAAALVAGIFFAFSSFVMGALGALKPKSGIAAMQSINRVVLNPVFFLAFFGTAALSLAVALAAWFAAPAEVRIPTFAGSALYLVGCILVTIAGNVPLNERLARADADAPATEALWALYLRRWTHWNHLRTAASFLAAAAFVYAGSTI